MVRYGTNMFIYVSLTNVQSWHLHLFFIKHLNHIYVLLIAFFAKQFAKVLCILRLSSFFIVRFIFCLSFICLQALCILHGIFYYRKTLNFSSGHLRLIVCLNGQMSNEEKGTCPSVQAGTRRYGDERWINRLDRKTNSCRHHTKTPWTSSLDANLKVHTPD